MENQKNYIISIGQKGGQTAHTINNSYGPPKRTLTEEMKIDLLSILPDKNEVINVNSPLGDAESRALANSTVEYLNAKGYKNVMGNQVIRTEPFYDQSYYRNSDGVEINIGPPSN